MMNIQRRITKAYFTIAMTQYAPLIQKLAFRIGINKTQVEELKSRAPEELLKCMICYQKSGSFMTFFHGRLSGLFRHMRDSDYRVTRRQGVPFSSLLNMSGPYIDTDQSMMIQEFLDCLNEEECDIITGLFFHDKSMRQIAEERDSVASTICRIKKGALDKMRRKCKVELG